VVGELNAGSRGTRRRFEEKKTQWVGRRQRAMDISAEMSVYSVTPGQMTVKEAKDSSGRYMLRRNFSLMLMGYI
jgi:hypothetical protein